MRRLKAQIPAVALAALIGIALAAQQTDGMPAPADPHSSPSQALSRPHPLTAGQTAAPAAPQARAAAVPVPSTPNSPEASNPKVRPLKAVLETPLGSQTAKPGDTVVLRTIENAPMVDGRVIPKGSKVLGQVVETEPAGPAGHGAKLVLRFDKARLANGQTLPIRSLLQSIAPPLPRTTSHDELGPAGGAPSSSLAGGSAVASGSRHSAGQSPVTATMPGASAEKAARSTGTVVARQGDLNIVTTAIPGVLVGTNTDGKPSSATSGVLLGARQNLHLDGGTQLVLAVTGAGRKASNAR